MVIRQFEEANDRTSTPAERRMLRQIAGRFDEPAGRSGHDGWAWLGFAIDDAVAAGSRYVAPRRIREILNRWERDGIPEEYAPAGDRPARTVDRPVTSDAGTSHRLSQESVTAVSRAQATRAGRESGDDDRVVEPFVAPVFPIAACGMSSRQVWSAVLADIEFSGAIGRSDISTWLRSAALLAVGDDGGLVLGVPHELALRRASGRYLGVIRQAIERVTGMAMPVTVVLIRDWAA